MHQIKVGNIVIDVVRKDIKNLHLAVYPPTGRIRVAAPLRIDDEAVRLFAISKLAWIKKHQSNFRAQKRQTEREYISGESHYFKGKRYLLNLIKQRAPSPNKVVIRNKKYIDLYVRDGSTRRQREKVMTEWYRQELKKEIPDLIKKWQKSIRVKIHDWGVKQMRTKWGSCIAAKHRIWLNLELAKKPERSLEYIIVHEMVHLLERKHSNKFIAYVDKFLPNWRFLKDELNQLPIRLLTDISLDNN